MTNPKQLVCEWCGNPFTKERSGPGRPPPYCRPECRAEAQNALAMKRMRAMRQRQANANPRAKRAVGRPKGS